jgi:hypothetical protein
MGLAQSNLVSRLEGSTQMLVASAQRYQAYFSKKSVMDRWDKELKKLLG